MTKAIKKSGIITDASVLIDYVESASNILNLISQNICKLYVPLPVLKEVDQLKNVNVNKLGIEIVEPTFAQIAEASKARQERPTISGQDAMCLVMAKDNKWACLTNDKALRSICSDKGICCIWGFEIMLPLVKSGQITAKQAYKVAQDVQSNNPWIKINVVQSFKSKLGL